MTAQTTASQTPQAGGPEEPVRVNHTARNIIIAVVVIALIAVGVFFGYRATRGTTEAAKGSESNPVKIGVVGATDPQWPEFEKKAKEAGIYVKIVDFQDYTSENPALDSGDLDLNEFQHLLYLANYNEQNNKDLQPIGGTAIYPLGVYSDKVKDIKDIEAGSTVAIPNDETNQARAIGVLKAAGLIELKDKWTAFSTPADIDESKSKVKVTPLKAEQVANSLKDPQIAAGVINNDYVADAGLKPTDAIYQDDAESEEARPYINVFVSRKADVNNETYLKLIKIFQTKDVLDKLQENSGGTAVFADKFSASELQGYLADIQKDAENAK
ncbi:MetQ/NlpA family ABC transporter substrate-binding protein [Bifidobacterium leontopitheci]|uniref:ABC transporter substrate-binding protein n=1 Tax=Bifidobacterium leontopitheci TaxID=2650774 RepID=A0A6I1GES4_9BIFI|nr:MetQ/NlpA family ABC transporter substrate-binding protein [Bifidobacterium leontopitheci]KAB7790130.1 ABC transporter substrate-binding protein [Bifidobacterium leontopitheci]